MEKNVENVTKVVEEDKEKYLREMEIALSCIDEMHDSLLDGDLENVFLCIKDLEDAIQQLAIMFERKKRRDKLVALVEKLQAQGVSIDFVKRKIKKEAVDSSTLTAMN